MLKCTKMGNLVLLVNWREGLLRVSQEPGTLAAFPWPHSMPLPLTGVSQTRYPCPPRQEGNKTITLVPLLGLKPGRSRKTEMKRQREVGQGRRKVGKRKRRGSKEFFK